MAFDVLKICRAIETGDSLIACRAVEDSWEGVEDSVRILEAVERLTLDTLVLWRTPTLIPDEHTNKFWFSLRNIIPDVRDRDENLTLLLRFIDYLSRFPRLSEKNEPIKRAKGFGANTDARAGLAENLKAKRVRDAVFYSLEILECEGVEALMEVFLVLASRRINPQGTHKFGHKFTVVSTLVQSARQCTNKVTVASYVQRIVEFLIRYQFEDEYECKCDCSAGISQDELIAKCAETAGEMGHNIIVTHHGLISLDFLRVDAAHQLLRQIEDQIDRPWHPERDVKLDLREIQAASNAQFGGTGNNPASHLRRALKDNDRRSALSGLLKYIDALGFTPELRGILAADLARHAVIRAVEHACTFPDSVFALVNYTKDPIIQRLLVCQLIMPPGVWQDRTKTWRPGDESLAC